MDFKKLYKSVWDEISYFPYQVQDWYRSIRYWFKTCFNMAHFRYVKAVLFSYPFSYSYEVEKYQLLDYLHYFKNGKYITQDAYDRKCMEIQRCLNVLKIVNNEVDTFEYNGNFKFIPNPDMPETYTLNSDDVEYVCKVKVNTKNIRRFVKNEKSIEFILKRPHELYEIKARYLYFKLKGFYCDDWWD